MGLEYSQVLRLEHPNVHSPLEGPMSRPVGVLRGLRRRVISLFASTVPPPRLSNMFGTNGR